MELDGKHVIVTGSASGIGRACAARFAGAGARVVVADLDGDRATAVAQEIGATPARVDVSREDEIRALIDDAQRRDGPIDLFFSNAGVAGPPGGPEADDAALDLTYRVNVMAHIWAARALLPAMLERGDGYLVSTASAAGLLTQLSALSYSYTKHAAVAVAEWLSITYGDAGIKVSCLCPQGVRTPMLDTALEDPIGGAPLIAGGLLEPDDVAAVVMAAIADERFLILPHEAVAGHIAFKGAQPERWLSGMRKLLRHAREATTGA